MRVALLALFSALFVAGCATDGRIAAETECESRARALYPPSMQQVVIPTSALASVPDGNFKCTSRRDYLGNFVTDCQQGTRLEATQSQFATLVDVNQQARSSFVESCAANKCVGAYGNSKCDPSAPVEPSTSRMRCQTSADCGPGMSCRSYPGGGTICRRAAD